MVSGINAPAVVDRKPESGSEKRMRKMRKKLNKELGEERESRKLDNLYMFGCICNYGHERRCMVQRSKH